MMSDFPSMHQSDISKALGQRWKELDPALHAQYRQMASEIQATEAAKYEANMLVWQSSKAMRLDTTDAVEPGASMLERGGSMLRTTTGVDCVLSGLGVAASVRTRSRRSRPTQRLADSCELLAGTSRGTGANAHSSRATTGRPRAGSQWCQIRPSAGLRNRATSEPLPLASTTFDSCYSSYHCEYGYDFQPALPLTLGANPDPVMTHNAAAIPALSASTVFGFGPSSFPVDWLGSTPVAATRTQHHAYPCAGFTTTAATAQPIMMQFATNDCDIGAEVSAQQANHQDLLAIETIDMLLQMDSHSPVSLPDDWTAPPRPLQDTELDLFCNASIDDFYGLCRADSGFGADKSMDVHAQPQAHVFFNPLSL
jgi:hypothetical protein